MAAALQMTTGFRASGAIVLALLTAACERQRTIAIIDVTIINPGNASRREHATVLIAGGKISQISDAPAVRVPRQTTVIHGHGKYLLPGFWDMQVHVPHPSRLPLYLANGVTGIRTAGGRLLEQQRWRREIEAGSLSGPRMIIGGPLLDGLGPHHRPNSIAVLDERDAASAVRGLAEARVDFITVSDGLSRQAFFAIASEAQQRHMPFSGHVPDALSPIDVSNAGMRSIENLDGVIEASSDPANAAELFATLAANQTWQVPTLVVTGTRFSPALKVVADLKRAGIGIMAGTDSDGESSIIPGSSLHEELKLLVEAGLSPMEALRAATSGPAEFLHRKDIGVVSQGALADLVLLSGDPTVEIANSNRIVATIAAGRLYDLGAAARPPHSRR